MIRNAWKFKNLLAAIALVAVEAGAQPRYMQLSRDINLRVGAATGQDRYLHAITTLPAGTVIEVDSNSMSRPQNYLYGRDLRRSLYGFVQGIKILKIPGKSTTDIQQMNRYNLFLSAREIRTSRPVRALFQPRPAWQLQSPSQLYRAVTGLNTAAVNRAGDGLSGIQAVNRSTYCSNCTVGNDARLSGQGARAPTPQAPRPQTPAPRPQTPAVVHTPPPVNPGVAGRASLSGYGLAPSCGNFMNANGTVGAWGQSVVSLISRPEYRSSFYGSSALGRLCPKFASLSEQQKAQAWVWFWASLANEESKCNPSIVHPTHTKSGQRINRVEGYGLWAAERHYGDRDHRGAACRSIKTVEQQAWCAIDTMNVTHFKKGHSAYRSSGSYWGPIHRANSQLIPHMKRFQGCF